MQIYLKFEKKIFDNNKHKIIFIYLYELNNLSKYQIFH